MRASNATHTNIERQSERKLREGGRCSSFAFAVSRPASTLWDKSAPSRQNVEGTMGGRGKATLILSIVDEEQSGDVIKSSQV